MWPRMEKVTVIHPHEASFSLDFRMEKVEVHEWGCRPAASPPGCTMPYAIRHRGLVTVKCLLPKAVYYEAENAINLKWFGSLAQASFLLAASVSL